MCAHEFITLYADTSVRVYPKRSGDFNMPSCKLAGVISNPIESHTLLTRTPNNQSGAHLNHRSVIGSINQQKTQLPFFSATKFVVRCCLPKGTEESRRVEISVYIRCSWWTSGWIERLKKKKKNVFLEEALRSFLQSAVHRIHGS